MPQIGVEDGGSNEKFEMALDFMDIKLWVVSQFN